MTFRQALGSPKGRVRPGSYIIYIYIYIFIYIYIYIHIHTYIYLRARARAPGPGPGAARSHPRGPAQNGKSSLETWTKFGRSVDDISTKFGRSFDAVSTKIGSFLQSSYEDRGPSYEVSTKIGVPKGQIRLPVDAISNRDGDSQVHIRRADSLSRGPSRMRFRL